MLVLLQLGFAQTADGRLEIDQYVVHVNVDDLLHHLYRFLSIHEYNQHWVAKSSSSTFDVAVPVPGCL